MANPSSMILSVAMLLSWLGDRRGLQPLRAAGAAMERAVDMVLEDPASRTRDLGGTMHTDAFGAEVARAVAAMR